MHPEFLTSIAAQRQEQLRREAEDARLLAQVRTARSTRSRAANRRRGRAANRLRRRANRASMPCEAPC